MCLQPQKYTQMLLPGMDTPVIENIPEFQSIEPGSIQEIIDIYLNKHWSYNCFNKLYNVLQCGTGKLGCHIDVCDNCGSSRSIPNPCDHSLCPYCQQRLSENWIENRISELLPVPYYQIVFKLPPALAIFALYNKKIVFDIFFAAVASAMNKIPDRDRIEIGFILSLQTCARNLWFCPHIHVCMPGVGILKNGKVNQYCCKEALPLTEEILSKEFCESFIKQLKKVYEEKNVVTPKCEDDIEYKNENQKEIETICTDDESQLKWPTKLEHLAKDRSEFDKWIAKLENAKWKVNVGDATRKDPKELIRYIGERLAISDDQIVKTDTEKVIFKDKRNKEHELTIEEFIRRLVSHAMPKGYHRIRNYGYLGNNVKEKKGSYILSQLGQTKSPKSIHKSKCKQCGKGQMRTVAVILGGETVKTFPEQIEKLKQMPSWLSILKEIESAKKIPAELKESIPTWLIELIQSVD